MKRNLIRVWLAVMLMTVGAAICRANWVVETEEVDASPGSGLFNAIALDGAGAPMIAYYEATNAVLKGAALNETEVWEPVLLNGSGDVGRHCSGAVQSNGVFHLSYQYRYPYYGQTRGDLKYLCGTNTPVTLDNSFGRMGEGTALARDAAGDVHIAYQAVTLLGNKLKYIAQTNGVWYAPKDVEDGGVGVSLALDAAGNPHIAHVSGTNLRYVFWNGSGWTSQIVEDYGIVNGRTAIALDSAGHPHVVFSTTEGLRYMWHDGSDWAQESVHSAEFMGDVGLDSPDLALSDDDEPFISYQARFGAPAAVVVARRVYDDEDEQWNWLAEAWLQSDTGLGGQTSLAIDGRGVLHVAFHDAAAGALGYATAAEDTDDDWLPDWWEMEYFQNLSQGAEDDPDGDLRSNNDEYWGGTDPTVPDEGGGGDSDGDGLTDDEEAFIGTDPDDPDSDGDGLPDGWEFWNDLDPLSATGDDGAAGNPDGDAFTNLQEYEFDLDPQNFWDGDPDEDMDWDYLTNAQEAALGTHPLKRDTDGDGLMDGGDSGDPGETQYGTDPLDPDSDGDGLPDGVEVGYYVFWDSFEESEIDEHWTLGGDAEWQIDPAEAAYGNGAQSARSAGISDNQSCWLEMEAVLLGRGVLCFHYKTSCQTNADYLVFSANGTECARYSGETDWTQEYVYLPAGTNTLRWAYEKDSSGSGGSDAVWIDLVDLRVPNMGSDPNDADSDDDGIQDGEEVNVRGTNPTYADTDGDGLNDWDEIFVHGTDPIEWDSDGDGIEDGYEADTLGTDPLDEDTDGDGIPDGVEVNAGLNPLVDDAAQDKDADGLTNLQEHLLGTKIDDADSDDDGLTDGAEVNTHHTDPLDSDSDGDGLSDGAEVNTYGTDPNQADADGDGLNDSQEVIRGTDPSDADSDDDGLDDGVEVNTHLTDPNDADSDDDGLNDGAEVHVHHTLPLDADTDNDGLADGDEVNTHLTDPNDADSDDDGLTDGAEVNAHHTDPLDGDSDGDGLDDGAEVNTHLTDPNDADSDDDGLSDGAEVNTLHTDPLDSDSDDDGLSDGDEVNVHGSSPLLTDTDADGLGDADEVNVHGTRPDLADTDGDGLNDGDEIGTHGTDPTDPDVDDDGLNDGDELLYGTDFYDPDSDGDTLTDGDEVHVWGCDPLLTDTDSDGMDDNIETVGLVVFEDSFESGSFTNPPWSDAGAVGWDIDSADAFDGTHSALLSLPDPNTSGDLRLSSAIQAPGEIIYAVRCDTEQYEELHVTDMQHAKELNAPIDVPSWTVYTNVIPRGSVLVSWNYARYGGGVPGWARIDAVKLRVPATHTDPDKADTDDDGVDDLQEIDDGTDPLAADSDGDGLNDGDEKIAGTDPHDSDSDGDNVSDGQEVHLYGTNPLDSDTDDDGLDDGDEVYRGTSPLLVDSDGDTLSDGDEVNIHNTDPTKPDTDGDGLDDAAEINVYGTLPLDSDTDNDGLSDGDEVNLYNCDPKLSDTDSDGIPDRAEVSYWGTRPDLADTDSDGLSDGEEALAHTLVDSFERPSLAYWWSTQGASVWQICHLPSAPGGTNVVYSGTPEQGKTNVLALTVNARSGNLVYRLKRDLGDLANMLEVYVDGQWLIGHGGYADWQQESIPLSPGLHTVSWVLTRGESDVDNPWAMLDLFSVPAAGIGTSPTNSDSDADGLLDGEEQNVYGTDPLEADTDGDGLDDGSEIIAHGTDPFDPDTDGDGLADGEEVNTYGTSPVLVDSDGDALGDGDEVLTHGTDPNLSDTDGDSLDDGAEINTYGTLPLDPDTDDDGLSDGREVLSEVVVASESFESASPEPMGNIKPLDAGGVWPEGWSTFGDAPWIWVGDVVYDGSAAMASGLVSNDHFSAIQYQMEFPEEGWLSSYVKVSSESPGDKLEFLADGSCMESFAGEVGWIRCESAPLSKGWHTFVWRYAKDGSAEAGADQAWLDLVAFNVFGTNTDPNEGDTDGDGMGDGWEVENDFDPLLPDGMLDPDNDGLVNSNECAYGTNPHLADSEGDQMPDGWEVANGLLALVDDADEDPDGDGLSNLAEFVNDTDPQNPDTDGDGLDDGDEVLLHSSSPRSADTDGDGLGDYEEVIVHGTRPYAADSDGDGQNDYEEVVITGMDPLDAASLLKIESLSPVAGGFELKWLSADGKAYEIMSTTNLAQGFEPLHAGVAAGIGGHTIFTNAPASGVRFYRVRVTAP